MKNLDSLLAKTKEKNISNNKLEESLAEKLDKFEKAEAVMGNINKDKVLAPKDKFINVSYMLPESYINNIQDIIRKCMREEISINKSELIRLGITMVSELSTEDLSKRLEEVRVGKGPKKRN